MNENKTDGKDKSRGKTGSGDERQVCGSVGTVGRGAAGVGGDVDGFVPESRSTDLVLTIKRPVGAGVAIRVVD